MDRQPVEELTEQDRSCLTAARDVRESAYAPYSDYQVGAAIVVDGETFTGQNIESVTFNGTMHAERLALMKAVSAGHRRSEAYERVAVTSLKDDDAGPVGDPPCGHCLQILTQFVPADITVIVDTGETAAIYTLEELLPGGMQPESLLNEGV